MERKLESRYDVILIRASMGGLTCGNFLCKKGEDPMIWLWSYPWNDTVC
jgi:hypothetical protein